jgi:hypothetical protein
MIKTLRITSIILAIAAIVLLVLPVVYGVRKDPKTEEFLKKPGVVEKFTTAGTQNTTKNDSQNSPLVKEAVKYTAYINPPPPPPPKTPTGSPTQPNVQPPAPPVASVKFDLVATSYYAANPEKSFVLIDEAGKGLHWVKQGSTIGHVTIDTVKDGAIIVRDGSRTSEMTVKVKETWRTLLKNPPPSTKTIAPASPSDVVTTTQIPTNAAVQAPSIRQGSENTINPSSAGQVRPNQPLMPSRRSLRPSVTPPAAERITPTSQPPAAPQIETPAPPQPQIETPSPPEPEESPAIKAKAAKIDKLLSEMDPSKLTKDEEKKMDEMFKELEELGKMRDAEAAKDANK